MPAAKLDKTEYLKARVDERIKKNFETICEKLEKKPAEQMRELIIAFIKLEEKRLGERIQIAITRPAGYDHGAWRAEIKLQDPGENAYPIVFPLPKLAKRSIHSDPECQAAWLDVETKTFEMGGLLQNGLWRGNLYTNGVAEDENPTSVEQVQTELRAVIEKLLNMRIPVIR